MEQQLKLFQDVFGKHEETRQFFCPGRVNLIGEHIDYLGGDVLPAAISLGIHATVSRTKSNVIQVHSTDFNETVSFRTDELPTTKQNHWSDYILGVLLNSRSRGVSVAGFNLLLESSLPKGSGLSSSAAVEVLTYFLISSVFENSEPNRTEMALACQRIENEFIGVNCGIMDQFAVANGKKYHAIKLNCDTLRYEHVPIMMNDHSLLIISSNKPRELAESAYNKRRSECEEALAILQHRNKNLKHLVQADITQLNLIEDELIGKRARHAITENQRVKQSEQALNNQNLHAFGKLMNESHASLRDDFEVSCAELDFIVESLQKSDQCLGARMTGAGFGGCCIALVQEQAIAEIENELAADYTSQFGFAPTFFICEVFDGVHELTQD